MVYDGLRQVGPIWTGLTANDVAALTFQNQGSPIVIKATVGAVPPPVSVAPGPVYPNMLGEISTVTLASEFPGTAGANRVYARTRDGFSTSEVWVSHA